MSTTGTTFSTLPIWPERKASGVKTATVVRNEDDSTPGATMRTPSTVASRTLFPLPSSVAMFSARTMASSIIRPSAMSSATMVSMLIVMPSSGMKKSAPRKATGRPMATQNE